MLYNMEISVVTFYSEHMHCHWWSNNLMWFLSILLTNQNGCTTGNSVAVWTFMQFEFEPIPGEFQLQLKYEALVLSWHSVKVLLCIFKFLFIISLYHIYQTYKHMCCHPQEESLIAVENDLRLCHTKYGFPSIPLLAINQISVHYLKQISEW